MKPVVAVATGDPFGIGPEICLKAATDEAVVAACRPLLIGDRAHLLAVAAALPPWPGQHGAVPAGGTAAPPSPLPPPAAWPEVSRSPFAWGSKQGDETPIEAWPSGPAFCDMGDRPEPSPAGGAASAAPAPGPTAAGGRSAVMYVKQAVLLARGGGAAAIVTAPASKAAMHLAGSRYPGHTELLADLCGLEPDDVAMMFVTPDLKVALATVHLPLRQAIDALTAERLASRLRLVRDEHRRWFGTDPRLAVCGLNPHAGEGGLLGREETEIIQPAIARTREEGIRVEGPFPADTLFRRAIRGEFDVVLALYHDQATIAVKTRSFGGAVNMTLGLPLLRTSVDHGTAWDIAGKGVADPGSLVEAILLAARLAGG